MKSILITFGALICWIPLAHGVVTITQVERSVETEGVFVSTNATGNFNESRSGIGTDMLARQNTTVDAWHYFGMGEAAAEDSRPDLSFEATSRGLVKISLSQDYDYRFDLSVQVFGDGNEKRATVGLTNDDTLATIHRLQIQNGSDSVSETGILTAGDYTLDWNAFVKSPAVAAASYEFDLQLKPRTSIAVPEPSMALALGMLGLASMRRKRKRVL